MSANKQSVENTDDYISYGVHVIRGVNDQFAAIITENTRRIFDYEDVKPIEVKKNFRGYVPWGDTNEQPYQILEKIRDDEVMSSNMLFNIQTAYGRGFQVTEKDTKISTPDIKKFFRRNNMIKFWLEQFTDIKHFFFSIFVIILDKKGEKIVQIRHKEAINCRFETCDPKTGNIENVFFTDWKAAILDENNVDAIPLLDEDDPVGDLMIRLGKEPDPKTGKNGIKTNDRMFAMVNKIPTPGNKYYPFPYYYSTFNSGWYKLKTMIPLAKVAKMTNGMAIRYLIELHRDYFKNLFESEKITDPAKKKERRTKEVNNIKDFLSGIDNQDKSWFSTYYIDPNGKEQKMVRIERIGEGKEGGDYITDIEEATNIVSYAMNTHPSLIGASPGKNKSINGTEARELFTMKQAMEKAGRDLMLWNFYMLNEVNGWDLEYDIPDLLLTTLDQKTDAIVQSQNNPTKQQNNANNNN